MTGDAMEQLPDGTFVWIDRVKNIIKLSQVSQPSCCFLCKKKHVACTRLSF